METPLNIQVKNGGEKTMMYSHSHVKEFSDSFASKGLLTVSNIWSMFTLIANIWTLFSVILWFSAKDHPQTGVLFIEIIVECYLLFEVFARILIRVFASSYYESLQLQHIRKNDRYIIFALVIVGSAPIMSIFAGFQDPNSYDDHITVFSRFLLLKLLRAFEIRRAFVRIGDGLFYKDFKLLVLFKFAKNFTYIVFITHLSTCGWLMVNILVDNDKAIEGTSSLNPLNQDQPYFTRNNEENMSLFKKYVDSAIWAVTTLVGCSFGDVTPRTLQELIISNFVFVIGILLLAKIFSDFASVLHLFDLENIKIREKSLRALKLCKVLGLPSKIRYKVEAYYAGTNYAYSQIQHFPILKDLPPTLFSEVALSLKQDLITSSNLFNFGTPTFVFTMTKYLYPKVSLAGDYVVRVGECANEMYFIKKGEVEILSSDTETQLAILREGAYFGEVGVLLNDKRSVSVRALTLCTFEVIKRDDFKAVLENYPKQREYLLKVAQQRAAVCTTSDLELTDDTNDLHNSKNKTVSSAGFTNRGDRLDSASNLTDKRKTAFRPREINTPTSSIVGSAFKPARRLLWQKTISTFKEHACKSQGIDFGHLFIILPNSTFYRYWMIILQLAAFTSFFMVPYEISFFTKKSEVTALWWFVDVLIVIIYFIDIFVHMNTSIPHRTGFISDKSILHRRYIQKSFLMDVLAFVPFDYFVVGSHLTWGIMDWIKVLRFFKVIRVFQLLSQNQKNGERKNQIKTLILLIIFHTAANHICACIMYRIALSQSSPNMFTDLAAHNKVDMPLTNETPFTIYIYFIYWAYATSSSGAYGDVRAITPSEKIFQIFAMLFFRVYFAFCAAEVANLTTNYYIARTENLAKQTTYEKWMRHVKLPGQIIQRVKSYNEYIWRKYRGLDENLILDDLPSSTRLEIFEFLLNDLLYSVELFPKDEVGFFPTIIKDFRFVQITKGEYVFKSGELAEEVYFVIGGKISIIDEEHDQREMAVLSKNAFFGETAIVETDSPLRTKSARAKTDVSLASLHVSYVRDIWKKYPNVKDYMLKIAQTKRGLFNKIDEELAKATSNTNRNEVKKEGDWILKDLDLHLKSQKESYREGRIKVLSEAELEFEKLREELADVLEPEQNGQESNTHRSDAGMLSMGKRCSESAESATLKFDPNSAGLKTIKSNPTNANDISGISQVLHKSAHITSRFEFDDLLNTIQNPEEENSGIIKQAIGLQTRSPRGKGFDANIDEQMNECFLASQPVDQSIDVHQLTTTRQKSLPVKSKTFLEKCEGLFRKAKPFLMTLVVAFEWAFAPTNLALDFHDFSGGIMAVEIIMVFIWLGNFLVEFKDYRIQKRKRGRIVPLLTVSPLLRKDTALSTKGDEEEDDKPMGPQKYQPLLSLAFLLLNFLYILPFQMIFKRADVSHRMTNFFLIALQLIRLLSINTLYLPFKLEFFKRKYAFANIIMALYVYVLANHIFACFFILIGKSKTNFNYTWLAKLPAPNFDYPNNYRTTLDVDHFTIYTSALYWSYVTTSHVGVGDVTGINALEKGYSTIIILLSTFMYAFVFGNLASLVDDMKPRFQKQFEENYRKALEYAKNAKIEAFLNKIHTYYAYIWQNSRGIDENMLMKDLPSSLKYDIFLNIYREIIDSSKLFKDEKGLFDPRVFSYLCQAFSVKIYMRNDFIVISGQEVKNVYLILEGEAEVVDYNVSLKGSKQLHPGDYFGGIFLNMPQVENIMATDMTKVAVIPQEVLFRLKGAFPAWYATLIKHEEIYKLGQRFLTNVRKLIQKRKDNPQVETPTMKSSYLRVGAADFRIKSLIPKSDLSLIDSESSEDSSSIEPKQFPMHQVQSPSHEPLKGNQSPHDTNEEPRLMSPISEELQFSTKARPLYRLGKPIIVSTDSKPQKMSLFGSKAGEPSSPLTKEGSPSKRFRFFKKSAADPDPEDLKSPAQAKKSGFSFFRAKPSKELNLDVPSPGSNSKREQMRAELGLKIEVGHAMILESTSMTPTRFQRFMSALRMPSFLMQDEEPSIVHHTPGRATPVTGITKKAVKKVNLKRTSTYGPKNFTNNFIHLIGLRKKQNDQMKHLKYYIDPNSGWRTCYELLYTSIAIYSLFVVPVFVGFGTVLGPFLTALEILILIGQIAYLILLMRTAQYHHGVLSLDSKMIWRKLWWEKGIILDLIATIPFNLIFSFTEPEGVPLLIGILKLNRVLLLPKVPPQLEMFSAKYPNFAVYFNILKPVFYLIFGSHLIACLFSFSLLVEPEEYYDLNFSDYLELDLKNKGRRYLVCLTFFLNIATTTGFPELIIYNNYERCIFIICIYLGDALFALVMGWVASSSSTLPRKFNDVFDPLRQVESVLEDGGISRKIKKKVEGYFKYMVESKSRNVSCLQLLDGVLPETLLKDMHYTQAQAFHNFPLLQAFKTDKTLVNEIVKNIKHTVYLPHDYIIARGDDGSSVFCIESGIVHMLSPTEKKVIAILKAGQIFGELGAYTGTKHLTAYVAASYCLIYSLDKETLKGILKTFPHANFEYKLFAKDRLDESTRFFVGTKEIYEKVFKHLQNTRHTATDKEEIQELLESSEVPHFMLVDPKKVLKKRADSSENVPSPADFGSPFLNDYIEQNKNEISFDQSIDQYVEDNELMFRKTETNKESLRVKTASRERRFSRVKMGGKKSGSKHHAVTIRWGVTIH